MALQPGMTPTFGAGVDFSGATQSDDPLVQRLVARFQEARAKRSLYEGTWNEIYDFTMPNRPAFSDQSEGQRRDQHIFDETAIVGVREFANRMQDGLIPAWQDWALLSAVPLPGVEADDVEELNRQCQDAMKRVFSELRRSNLYQVINENFTDIAVGSATLRFDDTLDGFHFQALPAPEWWWLTESDGRVCDIFQVRSLGMEEALRRYPNAIPADEREQFDARTPAGAAAKIPFLLAVSLNSRIGGEDESWTYAVINLKNGRRALTQQLAGEGASPMIPFRWSVIAGEIYGRGPLYDVLPAVKTANLVVQLLLENADMQIGGIWKAEDDGTANVDSIILEPGRVIGYSAGTRGLEALTPPGKFDFSQLILSDMRFNIKKGLFNETLGPREGTPPSATEVAQRMADLSRLMGPVIERLQGEALRPIVMRSLYLLRQRKQIDLPLNDKRRLRLDLTSPLVRQRDGDEIQRIARWMEQVRQQLGPETAKLVMKEEDIARYLADRWGVPLALVRSMREQQMKMAEMRQAAGAMAPGAAAGPLAAAGMGQTGIPLEALSALTRQGGT